jgi:hypothetical protein
MKKESIFILVAMAAGMVFISSCQKELKNLNDDTLSTPLPSTTSYCRINSFLTSGSSAGGGADEWFIQYDQFENPTSITTFHPIFGRANHTFKYDHWHRMIEWRQEVPNGLFQEWHFYGFDNNGRIANDSAFYMGQISDPRNTAVFANYYTLEYDNQGRIIRQGQRSKNDNFTSVFWSDFLYDGHGNLIIPGVTYDDKINMNRTNDIWQFLLRNYSMNNPFMAGVYNIEGYPITIPGPFWIIGGFAGAQPVYECRQSHYF